MVEELCYKKVAYGGEELCYGLKKTSESDRMFGL